MKLSILAIAWLSTASAIFAAPVMEETVNKTITLSPDASITIQNEDGAIWIYGANIQEVRLQAIKKAYSQERLDSIQIEIASTPSHLSIDTKYPARQRWSWRDRSGTVDYLLVVPWTCTITKAHLTNGEMLIDGMRDSRLSATLVNGRMFLHNCFANITAEVSSGGLAMAYDWWESRKFSVDAKIVNGNAYALLPEDAAFHLIGSSKSGNVTSDFMSEQVRERGGQPKIDIVTPGDPKSEISLHAVNGSIQVAEIKF